MTGTKEDYCSMDIEDLVMALSRSYFRFQNFYCFVYYSFKSCALNLAVDGSEDSMIHSFKNNQLCEEGSRQL